MSQADNPTGNLQVALTKCSVAGPLTQTEELALPVLYIRLARVMGARSKILSSLGNNVLTWLGSPAFEPVLDLS